VFFLSFDADLEERILIKRGLQK
jgi:hypothetical protein